MLKVEIFIFKDQNKIRMSRVRCVSRHWYFCFAQVK